MNPDRFQKVEVASAAQLRSWLERNYAQSDSVWLVTFKKVQADKYLSREEVLGVLKTREISSAAVDWKQQSLTAAVAYCRELTEAKSLAEIQANDRLSKVMDVLTTKQTFALAEAVDRQLQMSASS